MSVLQVVTANITNLSDGTNSTSSTNAIRGSAKAWVNFDGTQSGTITPRSSYNVTSVTKSGTGLYTINFTTAFSDTNYIPVAGGWNNGNGNGLWNVEYAGSGGAYGTGKNTGSLNIASYNNGGSLQDQSAIYMAFFR